MIFEGKDRRYVHRTRKAANANAFFTPDRIIVDPDEELDMSFLEIVQLQKPFPHEQWKVEGALNFDVSDKNTKEPIHFGIEYDSIEDKNMSAALATLGHRRNQLNLQIDMSLHRRIRKLTMKNSKQQLDMEKIIGADFSVYSYIGKSTEALFKEEGLMFPDQRLLITSHDITSPAGLYVFIHEAGHIVQHGGKSATELRAESDIRRKFMQHIPMSVVEQRTLIENERDVDAFALKTLKPFFGRTRMQDFKRLAYTAHKAYYSRIRNRTWEDYLPKMLHN